ncbi:hypothetical protein F5Y15DRAFT_403764 [Xylariaceae sp. FL0016]|nr:hypothetical protein F5Y15DRAFT_403764 [Xylariaceae sp. FL0016]
MTTVPLNNPTNSPPGAPAIGDPSRGADVDRIGVASTGAATITVASTITRELTYTLDGKVATSTRIITATFCPEHETVDREGYVIQKTAKTEPASTMVAPAQITAAPAALGVNLNGKDSVLAVTEHCSASTHVVTFCDAQDDSCTVGMITTEVVTMLETVLAAANPTTVAAQLADATTPVIFSSTSTDMRDNVLPAGNSEDSTAPGMPPTTIVPGVGFVPTYGAGSNSSMGIAGVSGSVSAVVGETIETTGPVMVAGAADNRCVDSWFVKLIFAVVAGLLVLLEV